MRIVTRTLAAGLALALGTVACAGGSAAPPAPAPTATSTPGAGNGTATDPADGVDLSSVCPNPIVIQTGWYPAPDRAWFYGLIGPGGEVDTNAGAYRGPALADPDVTVEVRVGGPAVGFQQGNSLLYTDPSILIADQNMDAMIAASSRLPTVGIFAPMQVQPQILMFDPATYDFSSVEDIRDSGVTVLVAPNQFYATGLVGLGKLDAAQIDESYDFSPSRFVATEGGIVQQGFGTSEPYAYEHNIAAWAKPVDYLYVHEAGYPNYGPIASVRPETVEEQADCLTALVPVMQQSVVDYLAAPDELNELIVSLSSAFGSPAPIQMGDATFAVDTMIGDGLVVPPGTVLGDFDLARVADLIDITTMVFEERDLDTFDPDITVEALVTNQFIDTAVTR